MRRKIFIIISGCCLSMLLLMLIPTTVTASLVLEGQILSNSRKMTAKKSITLTVKIYDDEFGEHLLYAEEHKITDGRQKFSLTIGQGKKLAGKTKTDLKPEKLWLEVAVGDQVMSPRLNLIEIDTTSELTSISELTISGASLRGAVNSTLTIDNDGIVLDKIKSPLLMSGTSITGGIIQATNDSFGDGIQGNTWKGSGVRGSASGTSGYGVCGEATDTGDDVNYGGYFTAAAESGVGVYGKSLGKQGIGVKGETTDILSGDANFGGYFTSVGNYGIGVFGYNPESGSGVKGMADGEFGDGIYGEASGRQGRGVYGEATYPDGTDHATTYGGYFTAKSFAGEGVYGESWGHQGCGVHGRSRITGNVGGVGVYGNSDGEYGTGVLGEARSYGGDFEATGIGGIGVRGVATETDNNEANTGGYFEAKGKNGIGVQGNGKSYCFYAALSGGTNYGPFTGGHDVRLADGEENNIQPGMIVSLTGVSARAPDTKDGRLALSSTMPTVALSRKVEDKAVFGVWVKKNILPNEHWYKAEENEYFGIVNALGEGCMWVCDQGGDIEAGDALVSSDVAGYGQKQKDDLIHIYTVGRATETVNWDDINETININGLNVKIRLITVVYMSG